MVRQLTIFTKFPMAIAWLTFAPNFAMAQNACGIEVRANDAFAEVSVDGGAALSVPVEIKCQATPQVVRVTSSDKQVFTRVIPAAKDFGVGDRLWNVHFIPRTHVGGSGGSVAQAAPILPQDSYQAMILKELVEIRRLFQGVVTARPELAGRVTKSLAKASRVISSDSGPASMSTEVMKRVDGVYIQLHSLIRKNIDRSKLESAVEMRRQSLSGASVLLCHWRLNAKAPQWTRVLVGPLLDLAHARQVATAVGEAAFLVKDPDCLAQPSDQAGF